MAEFTLQQAAALALQHYTAGNLGQAESICRQILAAHPNYADALHLLGVLANKAGRPADAVTCIERAIALAPGNASAHSNLGEACMLLGRTEEAIEHFRRALQLKPSYALAWYNLGNAHLLQDRLDDAIAAYRQTLQFSPDDPKAHNNLGGALAKQGLFAEAITAYRAAMRLMPEEPSIHSSLICLIRLLPEYDDRSLAAENRQWNQKFAAPLQTSLQPHTNDRDPHRRLRIGYVSGDFRIHAGLFFLAPLFREHDHQRFEIHGYSSVAIPDEGTEFLRSHADVWHNVRHLSNEALASEIRSARIDILVDLSMHTVGHQLQLFARKPAPVQVSWLAYAGTTGLDSIDYRISDRYFDPPGAPDPEITEKPVLLPDCWCCYHPFTETPPVNPLPALARGHITFGCLNNFSKLNDETLLRFSRVLSAVEKSRLVLLVPEGSPRQRLTEQFGRHGIARERIDYAGSGSRTDYLQRYHGIDIALDTLPANGMATTCETLWMGVPVVSLVGQTHASRAGLSLLSTIGLAELITHTPDAFVETVTKLATDLPHLANLRATMRSRMESSPLMDAPRFARNLEAAYRQIWQRWCATPAP